MRSSAAGAREGAGTHRGPRMLTLALVATILALTPVTTAGMDAVDRSTDAKGGPLP